MSKKRKKSESVTKEIKVHCEAAATISLDELLDFQGELKILTDDDFKKFRRLILKHGITAAVYVWRQTNGKTSKVTNYMLDGHQRLKVLKALRGEGYKIPEVPVAYIDAPTREVAKEILLSHVSSYGKVTREGLDMYMLDAGLEIEDMADMISIGNMSFDDIDAEPELKEEELKPYNKINILISFPPSLFPKVSALIEKITEIEGVEYEQSSL